MRRVIATAIAGISLGIASALAFAGPASAGSSNPIPPQFSGATWWNDRNSTPAYSEAGYYYKNFPVGCIDNATATQGKWQAVLVYSDTQTSRLYQSTEQQNLLYALHAAASAFSASAHKVFAAGNTGGSDYLTGSHAPRYKTFNFPLGGCEVSITDQAVPDAVYQADTASAGGLWPWMRTHGYNDPNTKYIEFRQSWPAAATWGGLADVYYNSNTPGPENAVNNSSHLEIENGIAGYGAANVDWKAIVNTLTHEMGHASLACCMSSDQPHVNTTGAPGHPSECFDVMCYDYGTAGQTYPSDCGYDPNGGTPILQQEESQWANRYDCHHDDFFNANNPAWGTTRWNGYKSRFLWGGTDRPVSLRNGGRSATTPTEHYTLSHVDAVESVRDIRHMQRAHKIARLGLYRG